jgi:cell wall-associated NlpC family hydrolase
MPPLDNTVLYAMYVIGKVESDWDWTATYPADPITIGMLQEYGQNASDLLKMCREGDPTGWAAFAASASSLASDVDAHGDSWSWWESRYLSQDEVEAWQTMAARSENHAIQQSKWDNDARAYVSRLETDGWSQERPQTLVYAMCIYHQSPQAYGQVTRSCGGSATLDTLHATTLNNWIGQSYSNRYNTAYSMLKDWDGNSAPPDFGQVADAPSTGDTGTVTQPDSPVQRVEMRNGQILVWGLEGYPNGLLCGYSAPNIWIPITNKAGAVNPGTATGGGDSKTGSAIVEYAKSKLGEWYYSQGSGRLDPESSGYTDCSGFVYWCYHHVAGIELGKWTGELATDGEEVFRSTDTGAVPWDSMQAGDVILSTKYPSSLWGFGTAGGGQHAQIYTGTPGEVVDVASTPCPTVRTGDGIWVYPSIAGYMVRRML